MGAIFCSYQNLLNTLLDVVVIKTGLVITEDELIDFLQEDFPEEEMFKIVNRENIIRIRSEQFDFYCLFLRRKLGELEEINQFGHFGFRMAKWLNKGYDPVEVLKKLMELIAEEHEKDKMKPVDPILILEKAVKLKLAPRKMLFDAMHSLIEDQKNSNTIFPVEEIMWDGGIKLSTLFNSESKPKSDDEYIDQKFINFLAANPSKLEFMHWRNFERLTAEFFKREGYKVELGTGGNDGGIDLRVYNGNESSPYIIVQCKRNKELNQVKIETVKSFYTDVEFEGAKKGLIATTSKIALGGKKVCSIRKYPLEFAENAEIKQWVNKMKKR